jgi:hypothetical protein
VRELEERIVDRNTNEVIAKYVDFRTSITPLAIGSSDLSDYKFWMYKGSCETGQKTLVKMKFNDLYGTIEGIGK